MNKEFLKKMIQAKQLEYEAIKEILPDQLKKKVDTLENDAIECIKDIAFDLLRDSMMGNFSRKADDKGRATGDFDNDRDGNRERDSARDRDTDTTSCNFCGEEQDGEQVRHNSDGVDNDKDKDSCKSRAVSNSSNSDINNNKKKSSRKINVDFM